MSDSVTDPLGSKSYQPESAQSVPPSPTPCIPDHELIRRIGRGAYGEVWLARSISGAFRAVKIVTRSSFDHERPFEREFEGILKFEPISRQHDSQVDILHVGRGDGYFYYVMELADDVLTGGQINPDNYSPRTLKSDVFQRARIPFEECVQIGVALTTALENLHENGLVHRDVKPSNIIFVNGVPKLADIGLVTGIDATHTYVGTEGFSAPEGSGTAQSDLYSLGKVLYEIATGKDRQEFPELPTQLRELPDREGLMELNAVIARACRHDPKDRYGSATEMRADLELLQSGKSLARLHRLERRLRFVTRAGTAVTVLTLLILTGWFYQQRQTREARQLAKENKTLADDKSKLAEDKSRLAEENRQRVVQLNIANGLREMEAGDLGNAMVWFADVLKYATNDPAQLQMLQTRLSMLLQMHPRPIATIPSPGSGDTFISNVLVSRNGRRLLTQARDEVDLWDLSQPLRRLVHQTAWPITNSVATLSSDGECFVLSALHTGESQLISIRTNDQPATIRLPRGLNDLWFADDDRLVVGVLSNHVVVAIDAHSGRVVREVARFDMQIREVVPSLDGRRVTVRFTNSLVDVVDITNNTIVAKIHLRQDNHIRFVETSGRFAASYQMKTIGLVATTGEPHLTSNFRASILDLASGHTIGQPLAHDNYVWNITGSPNGRIVATSSADKTVRLWNQFTGDALTPPLQHSTWVRHMAFSQDNTRLATGDANGNAQVWDTGTGEPVTPRLHHSGGGIITVAFANDGATLVTAAGDGLVRIWDLSSSQTPLLTLNGKRDDPDVRFSPDGKFLVVTDGSSSTRVCRVQDWREVSVFKHKSTPIVRISPDSQLVAILEKKTNLVYSLPEGRPVGAPLPLGSNSVADASFSPDGRTLATAHNDGTVRLWDWLRGVQLGKDFQHTGQVKSVLFSPRADRLLTTIWTDGNAHSQLWDVEGNLIMSAYSGSTRWTVCPPVFSPDGSKWLQAVQQYVGVRSSTNGQFISWANQSSPITCMTFSPDGMNYVTGSLKGRARIWMSVSNGLGKLPSALDHDSAVRQCDFSEDSRLLATQAGGYVRLWDKVSELPMAPPVPIRTRNSALHPSGRMLALGLKRRIMVLNLQTQWPADRLPILVQLTTGERVSVDGKVEKLDRGELLVLNEKIFKQGAEALTISAEQFARWHEGQIEEFGHLKGLASSIFHSESLLKLRPEDPTLLDRHGQFLAARVPSRDPAASARLIDLSDHFTRSFETLVDHELRGLPVGVHRLAGVEFDLRGLVVLDQAGSWRRGVPGEYPQVSHIRVAQRCQRLHFLQTCHGSEPEGTICARFIMHYADGSQRTREMIYGRDIKSWRPATDAPETGTVVAWQGYKESLGKPVRLYKAIWENPAPDLEVTHLEFQQGDGGERPILVAITAE